MIVYQPYYVSWWDDPQINYNLVGPHWISGNRPFMGGMQMAISAAVMAISDEDAMKQILEAHEFDVELDWIHIAAQPLGWVPMYNKNLPHRERMIWNQKPN
jgi:hypothetical protein